jgi:hypothetical protein
LRFFEEQMDHGVRERERMERELRAAIGPSLPAFATADRRIPPSGSRE